MSEKIRIAAGPNEVSIVYDIDLHPNDPQFTVRVRTAKNAHINAPVSLSDIKALNVWLAKRIAEVDTSRDDVSRTSSTCSKSEGALSVGRCRLTTVRRLAGRSSDPSMEAKNCRASWTASSAKAAHMKGWGTRSWMPVPYSIRSISSERNSPSRWKLLPGTVGPVKHPRAACCVRRSAT